MLKIFLLVLILEHKKIKKLLNNFLLYGYEYMTLQNVRQKILK